MKSIKTCVLLVIAVAGILFLSGCGSIIESTGGSVGISATGGPAALLNLLADMRTTGALKTTPGGFTARNEDPGLGAITNDDDGESKDVDIYVRGNERRWELYRGYAEVFTPGWVKVYEGGKWVKVKTPRWLKIKHLESIHFDTPFAQSVTLRTRDNANKVVEVKFDTDGRERRGSYYERINILFIKLPLDRYRLEVSSYTGKNIFKLAEYYPYSRYIYMDNDPADTQVGNTWIGWEERL